MNSLEASYTSTLCSEAESLGEVMLQEMVRLKCVQFMGLGERVRLAEVVVVVVEEVKLQGHSEERLLHCLPELVLSSCAELGTGGEVPEDREQAQPVSPHY